MAQLGRLCFNWKVLVALSVVGVVIWTAAPSLVLKALPLLLLAACPLSMLLVVWGMKRGVKGADHAPPACHEDSPNPARFLDPKERPMDLEAKETPSMLRSPG